MTNMYRISKNPESFEKALFGQIGKKIKEIRRAKKLKQEDLATMVKVARNSIVNIEAGKQNPSLILLFMLAEALSVSIYELIPDYNNLYKINHHFSSGDDTNIGRDSMQKIESIIISNLKP